MITGELKGMVDRVWDALWSGGVANPMEVIDQITYLLFIRRLDDLQRGKERKAKLTGEPIESPIYGSSEEHLRWSRFKNDDPVVMFQVVGQHVFPWLRALGGDGSTYGDHMRHASLTIPTPALLSRVIDLLEHIPMDQRDTNGDLYEYLLSKLASAGQLGQFRTPRHIIQLMVDMTAPTPADEICDPACGTAGFLVVASEYVRAQHPDVMTNASQRRHFHHSMFHGFDNDATMLRIGSMNMLMHGVERPDISRRDSLSEADAPKGGEFTLILANPPFTGSIDATGLSKDLLRVVKTKKTELLFLALFLKLLRPGGRAAVIVPDSVLFGASTAHKALRRTLIEDQKLDAVVKLPAGVFRPYAGVSTAILFFTKTDSGGTDDVWFYDVRADGLSLDDKRTPVEANDLPDVLARWRVRMTEERDRTRTHQSFLVPKGEIIAQGYALSLGKYAARAARETEDRTPSDILADLENLEYEISHALDAVRAVVRA